MPALLIAMVGQPPVWTAMVANTGVSYPFAGSTLAMQSQNVRNMSLAMELGQTDNTLGFFNAPDVSNEVLVQDIFGLTDGIVYNGAPAYTAVGDDMLIDCLEEAGQALALVA